MGRLQQIIDEVHGSRDVQERLYSSFPTRVAELCTEEEVQEIILKLEALATEWETFSARSPQDGDGQDDIWRDEHRYAELLRDLLPRFPDSTMTGLANKNARVRFWTAWTISERPTRFATPHLQRAMATESDSQTAKMIRKALESCSRPWWRFWN
ncbi:MAG: hypothetical protein JNM27_03355 [Leptospirales bacterium]|nr:hypothetical protein [Leptospirales bacterium]